MDLGNCFLNIMFIHYIVDFETGIVKKVFFYVTINFMIVTWFYLMVLTLATLIITINIYNSYKIKHC